MKMLSFDSKFKEELNSWKESEMSKGFSSFVCVEDVLLGDYLEYIANEMNIKTWLAFEEENLVGFVSYELKHDNVAHIEIVGVNPNFRKQGYSKKILFTLKEILTSENVNKLTLAVKKNNLNGIKAFSKFAKKNRDLDTENYLGFEI